MPWDFSILSGVIPQDPFKQKGQTDSINGWGTCDGPFLVQVPLVNTSGEAIGILYLLDTGVRLDTFNTKV